MAVTWPAALPDCIQKNDFSFRRVPNLITSPTDTGPGKVRPKQTISPIEVDASVIIDTTQVHTLMSFYVNTVNYGSTRFTWTELDTVLGDTFENQFVSPPEYHPEGLRWRAKLSLQSWPV